MPGLTRRGLCGALAAMGAAPPPAWATLPPTPALPRPDASGVLEAQGGARLFHAAFGTGEPVLLLHGGLANAAYWGHLVPALAQRRRVLVMDARGHGRSTLGSLGLSYPLLAQDAVALLDALGIARAAVVGWSDGGIAGLMLALSAPQRLSRLFAFGANYSRGGGRADAQAQPAVRAFTARTPAEYQALSPTPAEFPRLRQALQAMWQGGPNLTPAQLAAIRTPTTVAAGEHDEFIAPAHTRAMAAAIPGAALVVEPGVSHFAMLQDPVRFNAEVLRHL